MERVAALVPRPRLHLIRFHGVLAPNAKLRSKIVPAPPEHATEPPTDHARAPGRNTAHELGPAAQAGLRHRHRTLPQLRQRFEDHRRPFDTLRTGIEDPPVIVKILSHLGLPSRARRVRQRVESIYSRRSEEPKAACQRKPTAPLALSSTERLHKKPFACLPTALRPSRPVQQRIFHQAE